MSKNFTKRSKALSYQRRCKYKIFLRDDPISAFLFILDLVILFVLIKSKPEFEGIFYYSYFYSAYAHDTTFFLKGIFYVKHMVDTFYLFLHTFQD